MRKAQLLPNILPEVHGFPGNIPPSDLSFSLQIDKVVTTASQMVGWGLRTFRSRGSYLLLTMFKSLVQAHLDYCSYCQYLSVCSCLCQKNKRCKGVTDVQPDANPAKEQ
jgi:hypothetical protein